MIRAKCKLFTTSIKDDFRHYFALTERVKRGAKLLDTKYRYWYLSVDLDTLDINCTFRCVLGQLYGRYRTGKSLIGVPESKAFDYGFNLPTGTRPFVSKALTRTWKKEIKCRQKNYIKRS